MEMKPETIARRQREKEQLEWEERERFLQHYAEAAAKFPIPSNPPEDRNRYFAEFPDGRAVSISSNQWYEC